MKLEELVPPLELCKLIPEGEFEDSALMWVEDVHPTLTPFVEPRRYILLEDEEIPAPTLEEIMEKLPSCVSADSAVDGAMKLWLKTKGIDYGK